MALTKDIQDLAGELAVLQDRLKEISRDSNSAELLDKASQKAQKTWNDLKDTSEVKRREVQEYAQENPWRVAAAGVAVGVLLAHFLKKNGN